MELFNEKFQKNLYHFYFQRNNSFISCRCRYNLFSPATDEHTYKNFKYRILDDNTAEICGYTGKNAVVTVPDSIDSKPVTSIGRTAFLFRQNQGSDNSKHSKKYQMVGFYGCESLEKINHEFWFKNL
mgnify:CR=1 FL=1